MSDDVLITPASRKIEFFDSGGNIDGKIELSTAGDLDITAPNGGKITIGDISQDVHIGVDLVFDTGSRIYSVANQDLTIGKGTLGGNDVTIDGAGAVLLSLAGTEKARLTSTGLGIGTPSPDYTLDVAGNIGVDQFIYHNGDTDTYLNLQTDDARMVVGNDIAWWYDEGTASKLHLSWNGEADVEIGNAGSTPDFFFGGSQGSYNGRMGIGTATPGRPLHVVGDAYVQNGDILLSRGNFYLQDASLADYRGSFASAGVWAWENVNVGIGTTSPDAELHVEGSVLIDAYNAGAGSGLFFRQGHLNTNQPSITVQDHSGANPDGLAISAYDGISFRLDASEKMRIASGGNVGIGTTSPAATVDIKTSGSGSRTAFNSVADDLVVDSTSDTGITISSSNTATGNVFFADSDNDSRGQIRYDHAGNTMRFSTSGAEVMRLGSNGNVGIGTTSPQSSLHISSGTSGDAVLILEADTDNNNETDQPYIVFEQDGGVQHSAIGSHSGATTDNNALILSNSVNSGGIEAGIIFKTGSTTAGYANATERMRILPTGGIKFNDAYTFPTSDGSANQVLQTDGSGNLSFATVSGSGSPAGSDSYVQYNNGGSFGGDADFTWDDTNNRLVIGSTTSQHDGLGKLTVKGTDASFLLEKHDDSASGGPTMTLYRYSASVADNDLIGQVNFRGEGSTGNPSTYLSIRAEIEDTTEGTKDGALIVRGLINNTQTNLAEIHGSGLTLNQGTFNGNMGTTTYKPSVYMDTGTQNVNQTEATLGFNSEVLDPASNASSTTDGHIRLAAGGYYRISYSIPINDDGSTGGDRTRVFTFMQVDDNNSFTSPTTVAQSRAQVYTRENSGGSGLSSSFIYQHTANDYIRLRIDAEGTTDISTESNQSQISIEYLGPA